MKRRTFLQLTAGAALAGTGAFGIPAARAAGKDIVYLTPGLDLPFWRYLSKGVEKVATEKGYGFQALDSHNSAQTQLQNAQDAIARGVAGIVIPPTDSSTAPTVLSPRPSRGKGGLRRKAIARRRDPASGPRLLETPSRPERCPVTA